MKTLEDLLGDREARVAVETLVAHGYGPDVVSAAVTYLSATGVRRSPTTDAFHARQRASINSHAVCAVDHQGGPCPWEQPS